MVQCLVNPHFYCFYVCQALAFAGEVPVCCQSWTVFCLDILRPSYAMSQSKSFLARSHNLPRRLWHLWTIPPPSFISRLHIFSIVVLLASGFVLATEGHRFVVDTSPVRRVQPHTGCHMQTGCWYIEPEKTPHFGQHHQGFRFQKLVFVGFGV